MKSFKEYIKEDPWASEDDESAIRSAIKNVKTVQGLLNAFDTLFNKMNVEGKMDYVTSGTSRSVYIYPIPFAKFNAEDGANIKKFKIKPNDHGTYNTVIKVLNNSEKIKQARSEAEVWNTMKRSKYAITLCPIFDTSVGLLSGHEIASKDVYITQMPVVITVGDIDGMTDEGDSYFEDWFGTLGRGQFSLDVLYRFLKDAIGASKINKNLIKDPKVFGDFLKRRNAKATIAQKKHLLEWANLMVRFPGIMRDFHAGNLGVIGTDNRPIMIDYASRFNLHSGSV